MQTISPQNARIEALEQWVRMGGTLVLCAGSHAEEVLQPARRWRGSFPAASRRPCSAADQRLWETYAKSVNPIPPPKPGEKVELPTPRLADVQGKVEAHEGDLPLVIRKPQGLGQVVFVATDLDRGPIRDWTDRPMLVGAVLDLPANEPADAATEPVQSYGYNDLAGQLRSALDLPRDVHLVPFFVVALLVIVYILLIGPGDYFLLRRLGRGMQWTWITFPTIVVLFAVGAYVAAYWLKGDQLRVSQVDLVDIDAEGTARGPVGSASSVRGAKRSTSPCGPACPTASRPGDQRFAGLVRQGGQRIQRHVWPRHAKLPAALEPGLLDRFVAGCDPRRADPGLGFQEFRLPLAGTTPRPGTGRSAQG